MRYFLLLCLLPILSLAQDRPSYEEVLLEFHQKYMPRFKGPTETVWEKHPDGWYYTLYSFEGDREVSGRYLFWSAATGLYQDLALDSAPPFREAQSIAERVAQESGQPYRIQPFYGYAGWEDDVIDSLADKVLDDDQLYALGRAHSSKATSLIEPRGAIFQDAKKAYISGPDDKLSDGELLEYMHHRMEARNCFRYLSRSNKNYPTPVGEPAIKAANEIMTAYVDLRQYYSFEKAKSLLERNLYHGFIYAEAVNRLISCPPNAILITNGDNDTYPLYFAQDFHEVRPDVRVINRSLLNLPAYSNFYREAHGKQQAIQFSITKEMLADPASELTVIRPEGEGRAISWEKLIEYLKDPNNHFQGSKLRTWKSPSLFVNFNYRGKEFSQRIDRGTRSEMLMVDMMANNDVPFCFEQFTPSFPIDLAVYKDHLVKRGMIIELDTTERELDYSQLGTLDFDGSYQLLMGNWSYRTDNDQSQSAEAYAEHMRYVFAATILSAPDSTYKEQAKALLNQLEEFVPSAEFKHHSQASLQVALAALSLEELETSRKIVQQVKFEQEKILASMPDERTASHAQYLLDYANQIEDFLNQQR